MIRRLFIDTDIVLDVALAREPFVSASSMILAMAENNVVTGTMSSNAIANVYYVLRKAGGDAKARAFIGKLLHYLTVITIDHQNVLDALISDFSDFEDALQNCSAVENQCDYIITRNTNDYKNSALRVATPEEFLQLFR